MIGFPVWSYWRHKFIPYTSSRSPIQQIHVKSVSKTMTRPVSSVSSCSEVAFLSLFMTVKCVAVLYMFAFFCACVSGMCLAGHVLLWSHCYQKQEGRERRRYTSPCGNTLPRPPSVTVLCCLSTAPPNDQLQHYIRRTVQAKTTNTLPHAPQSCLFFSHFPQIADKIYSVYTSTNICMNVL